MRCAVGRARSGGQHPRCDASGIAPETTRNNAAARDSADTGSFFHHVHIMNTICVSCHLLSS